MKFVYILFAVKYTNKNHAFVLVNAYILTLFATNVRNMDHLVKKTKKKTKREKNKQKTWVSEWVFT